MTTDIGYSSFLLSQKDGKEEQECKEEEEEDEGKDADSPSREEYRQGLLTALSRSRGKQKSLKVHPKLKY